MQFWNLPLAFPPEQAASLRLEYAQLSDALEKYGALDLLNSLRNITQYSKMRHFNGSISNIVEATRENKTRNLC